MKKLWTTLLALAGLANIVSAQESRNGALRGKIHDAAQQPVELANVILFNAKDSALVTGTTSKANGAFQLEKIPFGNYYLDIQFIGYKTKRIADLTLDAAKTEIDLGKILLQQTTLNMKAVEVQGEATSMSYRLDKKVINVGKQHTALSGTAVDVLENVPAVSVDIEGNVSLRGSGNFTVLVDGRPSILEPSETLQQIPASTIANIEIITNPSAKYDPQGAAGIINVVLKQERRAGQSGVANLNAGAGDKYGGDFVLDLNDGKLAATLGADYNHRVFDGSEREENQTRRESLTSFIESEGDSRRDDTSMGGRAVFKFKPNKKDLWQLSARLGERDSRRTSDLNYAEWSNAAPDKLFYRSNSTRGRDRNFFALNSSYHRDFAQKGHELNAELSFRNRNGDEATTNALLNAARVQLSGRRSTETGPSRELEMKLDYTLPLREDAKLEAGYENEIESSEDRTSVADYDANAAEYVALPQFNYRTKYEDNTHALYAIFASAWRRFGYQAGVRAEYTGRKIDFEAASAPFKLGQWDYFPTLHVSRQFGAGQQAMASYTRRIDRPGGGELEPFETWRDAYNVQIGNPSLKPEYIDSYELGYQTNLGASVVSTEAYYRVTRNRIEDVRSVYADNVTLHTSANLGKDYAFGSELAWNFGFAEKWNANLSGNVYHYRIAGVLLNESFERESFNWSARMSHNIKLGDAAQFQLDGNYNSPSVAAQGRREGFFTAHAALKYELLDKLLTATLQVRDLFRTAKNESLSEGADFYNYNLSRPEAPVVMLNLKYNFNNYKSERNANREEQGEEEEF